MKIRSLQIKNFGPYRGPQKLTFPSDETRNVAIVFGDNMRGKTSLLNALRWAFYGQAFGRRLEALPISLILNKEARDEGDWNLSTFVTFESEGTVYDLRRVTTPKEGVGRPRVDADFRTEISLMKNGEPVRGDRIQDELNQVMPQQVARFSLFDGELLQEYELLLREDDEQGRRIKEAIEQVLGVPALVNGREELRTLLKKAQQRLARESRHVKGLESQTAQFDQLSEEISTLERERQDLVDRISRFGHEIAGIEEVLARTAAAERAAVQMTRLKDRREDLERSKKGLTAEKATLLADAWRDLLKPRLFARISSYEAERTRLQAQLARRGAIEHEIGTIRAVLNNSLCGVCGQEVGPVRRDQLGTMLGRLEGELRSLESNLSGLVDVGSELQRLERLVRGNSMPRIVALEDELNRLEVEATTIENEIDQIEKEVSGQDTAEIARQRALRDQLLQLQGAAKEKLSTREADLAQKEDKRKEISKLLGRNPDERLRQSSLEVDTYSGLERTFGLAIDELRDRLREGVAHLATEAFLRLTTEPEYARLNINQNYGLTIVDRLGRSVPLRSAGAEQVVALSLISGLNRQSGKGLPMIMDTPLGRLDKKHRNNILTHLPHMAPQVVLLAHEGELDPVTGLDVLSSHIGVVYEIERVSQFQSKIVRRE